MLRITNVTNHKIELFYTSQSESEILLVIHQLKLHCTMPQYQILQYNNRSDMKQQHLCRTHVEWPVAEQPVDRLGARRERQRAVVRHELRARLVEQTRELHGLHCSFVTCAYQQCYPHRLHIGYSGSRDSHILHSSGDITEEKLINSLDSAHLWTGCHCAVLWEAQEERPIQAECVDPPDYYEYSIIYSI